MAGHVLVPVLLLHTGVAITMGGGPNAEGVPPMNDDADDLLWPEGLEMAGDTCSQGNGLLGDDFEGTYNRLPKAGSGFVKRLIEASGLIDHFRIENEFDPMEADDDQRFTMGSVRNPCNYYVSLYSYGATGHGAFRHDVPHEYYKANDTATFKKWLWYVMTSKKAKHHDAADGPGLESIRFATSYNLNQSSLHILRKPMMSVTQKELNAYSIALESFDTSKINCWVKTENIVEDTKTCFARFESEAGVPVDWASFYSGLETIWQNPSSHKACNEFFDAESEAFVRSTDSHLFRLFNYTTCCG